MNKIIIEIMIMAIMITVMIIITKAYKGNNMWKSSSRR